MNIEAKLAGITVGNSGNLCCFKYKLTWSHPVDGQQRNSSCTWLDNNGYSGLDAAKSRHKFEEQKQTRAALRWEKKPKKE